MKDLEDNLWFDIKKAKASFVPSHTKLLDEKGEPIKSCDRPYILADHFEKKQWAINERNRETLQHNISMTKQMWPQALSAWKNSPYPSKNSKITNPLALMESPLDLSNIFKTTALQ